MVSELIPMLKFLTTPDTWPMKNMPIISLEYTPASYKSYCAQSFFHVYGNNTTFKHTICSYDKPVTLKQSQGHQTYTDNVGPKEGYNHARFERSGLNGIWETPTKEIIVSYLCPNVQVLSNEKTCQLSLLNIREKKKKLYIHDLLDVIKNLTKLQFIRIRKDFFFS